MPIQDADGRLRVALGDLFRSYRELRDRAEQARQEFLRVACVGAGQAGITDAGLAAALISAFGEPVTVDEMKAAMCQMDKLQGTMSGDQQSIAAVRAAFE